MRSLNLLLSAFFLGTGLVGSAQCGLFFSEYSESNGGNTKYLEIYNPTNAPVSLAGHAIAAVANAPSTPGVHEYWNQLDETAVIAPGDVYVWANSGSEATVLVETDQTGNAYFNGDDSYALVSGTEDSYEFIDIIGNFEADPGSGWAVAGVANATKDHTLVRKGSVTQGVGYDWAASAGTDADDSQWIVYDQNTWDYVGSHEFTGSCGAAVPGCTNENATNYNVAATEDDGSCTFDNACNEDGVVVTTASLYYSPQDLAIEPGTTVIWENIGGNHNANGTTDSQTGESFGNPEAFFFEPVSSSGEAVCIGSFTFTIPGVYAYDCSVGSHAAAGMVGTVTVGTGGCMNPAAPNYNESADYDDGSCLEVQTTSIATIQEGQLTDAYTGTTVVTNGVVTGVFGSLVSLQDGQGPYSGIWMYNPNVNVVVGDDIEVTGTVSEYNGLTQLSSPSIVINAQGAELPTPEVLSTGTAASDEQWEGVLVQVTGDVSSESLGYGEWGLDDTSGECRVDDRGYDVIDETGNVAAGSTWQVTGPLDYSFGNYKIQPRSEADALLYGCTDMSAANYNPGAGIDDGTCESSGQTCGLFFSEFASSLEDQNRYLEIYNPTSAAIFLGQYILGNQSNGGSGGSVEVEWWTNLPFTASISPGGTFIVAHPSADSLILANADMTHPYLSNGNDAYGLYSMVSGDTVLIDIIGAYGPNPGTGWDVAGVTNATEDRTLVRNEFVYAGNGGDWAMSAGTNALDSEWMVLDNSDWSDLGSHTFSETCISVTAGCLDPFAINYDPTMLTDNGSCFYPTAVTIQEIQEGGLVGPIQTSGVVTAVYESFSELSNEATFVIQDGTGPYSAIWVVGTGVQEGDEVTVTGTASDWYGLQWISPASYTVQSSGNTLPAVQTLDTDAINDEQWEAVLVEMSGTCIENGVDQAVDAYGQWKLDDGSGSGMVSRIGYDAGSDSITNGAGQTTAAVELGAKYKVTGPNMHSYSNWKLAPRSAADVVRIGCTDPTFSNYDAFAQEDDGTCVNAEGCTNPAADNYDPAATIDNGSCIVSGCDDPAAFNYQEGVTNPTNEECYYTLPNIVINEIHYNPCTDQGGDFDYEFVELVNIGDSPVDLEGLKFYNTSGGSPQLGLTFPAGATAAPGEYLLLTISDESTANYSGLGAQVFQLTEGNFSNSGEAVSLEDGFGNVINAVTYDDASPWPAQTVAVLGNVLVQSPDGGCSSLELIETDLNNDNPSNWQASWVDHGTPGAPNSSAFGCIDAAACNYASGAFFDDESCTYDCYGCTYEGATNYDATATIENGLCEFDFTDPCPADVNEDGQVGTPDLLFFLSQFGTMCPE